ncbi:MAG TPA: four helix bundle protein [Candidatus Paceibacterota bacterium]
MLECLKLGYKVWQEILPHISKSHRQTIGVKIDRLLLETLDLTFRAAYSKGIRKIELVSEAMIKNDLAKFFLLLMWECKILVDKKYVRISPVLVDAGKMLSGWKEYLEKKNPSGVNSFGENR